MQQELVNNLNDLMCATLNGDKKIVQFLIDNGHINKTIVNLKNKDDKTALHIAAEKGYIEIVKILVENGANLNERNRYGETALHNAAGARNGDKKIVQILVEKGANVNAQSYNGYTALIFAAEKGNKEIVQILIDRGANVNESDILDHTALHIAAKEGHEEIVQILIDNEANINAKIRQNWFDYTSKSQKSTALHIAAENGYIEIVKILLQNGANVNEKNLLGWTALHYAAFNGNNEIVQFLLHKGANVNEKDKDGWTALFTACFLNINKFDDLSANKLCKILQILIDKGANVNEKDNKGWTALHHACEYCFEEKIVQILIDKGANVNEKDNKGWTALDYAYGDVRKGIKFGFVRILVENDANVDFQLIKNNNKDLSDNHPVIKYLRGILLKRKTISTCCLVCNENFKDPVILDGCGHSFCRDCCSKFNDKLCFTCNKKFVNANPNFTLKDFLTNKAAECLVCYDMFDYTKNPPFSLNGCGHSLCEKCLKHLQCTNCPYCRKKFTKKLKIF